MNVTLYDINGNEKGQIELSDDVFGIKPNKSVIYYALKAEHANNRQGTASTKGRSEVSGSGAKPWRQKGTGRARAGSRRSPIWVGGGTVFGPKPRDYTVKLPKKMKRLSIRSILSQKLRDDKIKVVEDFTVDSGKTKDFYSIANRFTNEDNRKRVIFIDYNINELNKRASRNIPWVIYFNADMLNSKDLYYSTQLILTESAVKHINEKYSKVTTKKA